MWSEAARDDGDLIRLGAVERHETAAIVGRLGDDGVGAADHVAFDSDAVRRELVRRPLMQSPHETEPVKRHDERYPERSLELQRHGTRHEEMRMHDIIALRGCESLHERREFR